MADFSFSEDSELQRLNAQVLDEPEEFEHWEKLVRAAESQEGGLNRNSSPAAIASTRDTYDRFLARFPLFFGYWKKYADLEFSIAGTEAAEMVYERGIASIGTSVDLWANYCSFRTETSHDIDMVRDLFERAADSVGLDFLAHPFWDKYIEYEERLDAHDKIFQILERIINIPMHQYARYFERFRSMAATQPISSLAPEDVIVAFRQQIERESGAKPKQDADKERELRQRLDTFHLEIFHRTQAETTKRWTYEQEIKRPYYHVTELDEPQLVNWRKYLEFEEGEGDYRRTKFLYERCLVTAANYDEFWLRYARWMKGQDGKEEEVRNIYQRASCLFVPISSPTVRLRYAHFEESLGYVTIAKDILEAILMNIPSHLQTVIALVNLHRRQQGDDFAIQVLRQYLESAETSTSTRGALVAEWARLAWEVKGQADEARKIYNSQEQWYADCKPFWMGWFFFELKQPTSAALEPERYQRVKAVFDDIRHKSHLTPASIEEVAGLYMVYLEERGGSDAMKEYMELDKELFGPLSVRNGMKAQVPDGGNEGTTHKQMMLENGKYYAQQGDANGQLTAVRHPG